MFKLQAVSEREVEAYEARKSELGTTDAVKPIKAFEEVQLLTIDDKLYLVAGQIFLLGDSAGDNWARPLTDKERDIFPLKIIWEGEAIAFEADSLRATELSMNNISWEPTY